MTKVKMCGLSRPQDIINANEIHPDFIGFVFFKKSKRNVSADTAAELKSMLSPDIPAVGVFVNEPVENIAKLLADETIDIAQIHGDEDEAYIARLRALTDKPIIQAFKIKSEADIKAANASSADYVLLDSGMGTGKAFDWDLIKSVNRPYFLAGGLDPITVCGAVTALSPYAVDVSSGIETDGVKDRVKMSAFMAAITR